MMEGPVGPLLIRLAIPMIFGLISILLITLVDTFLQYHDHWFMVAW